MRDSNLLNLDEELGGAEGNDGRREVLVEGVELGVDEMGRVDDVLGVDETLDEGEPRFEEIGERT